LDTGRLFEEHNAVFGLGQPTVVSPAVPLTPAANLARVPGSSVGVVTAFRVTDNFYLIWNTYESKRERLYSR